MTMIEWDASLETGFPIVDEQHQQLVIMINDLYDALTASRTENIVLDIVNKMVDYTQYHFFTEEQLMKQHRYPELEAHKIEHLYFIEKAQDLDAQCRSGNYAGPAELLSFLTEWLMTHIKRRDMAACSYLRDHRAY